MMNAMKNIVEVVYGVIWTKGDVDQELGKHNS